MNKLPRFVIVGENIHCTRIFKVGGKNVEELGGGRFAIRYQLSDGGPASLPVPAKFTDTDTWRDGKVKHCSVAVWQGKYGDDGGRAAGRKYLETLAIRQKNAGADYLDLNVDEFSTDVDERVEVMKWLVGLVQGVVDIPVSVDSSNQRILDAGLQAAGKNRAKPMVNSVSLERAEAVGLAARYGAVVIASAAGETGLPNSVEERMANLDRLMGKLKEAGFKRGAIHVDPLVYPISTDPMNGKYFLDTVSAARKAYGPDIHIVAGLSNVSFGMPKRSLINIVFTHLACEAGADGGIVDPLQINREELRTVDPSSKDFKLARDLLLGTDEFGMNFISASRSGDI
jgi:5-methyltetrahydrofolate--homocysteine methyltransferase